MKNIISISRKAREEKGFTIIEVLIAISILSIGLLAVASMQVAAIRANSTAAETTEALAVAQSRMENLHALAIPTPTTGTPFEDTNGDGNAGVPAILDNSKPTKAEVIAGGDALLPCGAAGQPDHGETVTIGTRNYYRYWNVGTGAARGIHVIVAWHERGMHRIILSYNK